MKKVRLGDYIEQIRGVSYKPTDLTSELGNTSISLLRANNISNGIIVPNELQYIKRAKVSQNQVLRVNDILMCTSSGSVAHVGKIALMTSHDEYTFGAFCKVIRTTHELSPQYVALFLSAQSTRRCIEHNAKGANINNLRNEDIDNLTIPYCSREIQQKICQRISAVKRFIHKRQMQLEKLDELVKARFVEMFGDPVSNPRGFPTFSLGEIVKFQGGSQPDKKYFEYESTPHNIRLIQIRDYKSDRFITYIPKALAKRFCSADDIMIGRYGPPIFQILGGIEGSFNVALMKAIPQRGNKDFIRYFLKQDCLLKYLEGLSQRTAGQDGIQMDKLKAYPFPYPPEKLQTAFAAFVEEVDKSKVVVQKSLEKAQQLYDSLMQQYFD